MTHVFKKQNQYQILIIGKIFWNMYNKHRCTK